MVDRIVVTAPAGKLGILVVDNETNQASTVISKVNDDSPLAGKVFEGDQIVTLNGIDVHRLDSVGLTDVFQQQRGSKKTITIARSVPDAVANNGHGRNYIAATNSAAGGGEAGRSHGNEKTNQAHHVSRKKTSAMKQSKVAPVQGALSHSEEKHHGIPVNTDVDIESGREPIEPGLSNTQEGRPRCRAKRVVPTVFTIAVIILFIYGVVKLAGTNKKVKSAFSDLDDSSYENSWYDDVDDNASPEDTFWDETEVADTTPAEPEVSMPPEDEDHASQKFPDSNITERFVMAIQGIEQLEDEQAWSNRTSEHIMDYFAVSGGDDVWDVDVDIVVTQQSSSNPDIGVTKSHNDGLFQGLLRRIMRGGNERKLMAAKMVEVTYNQRSIYRSNDPNVYDGLYVATQPFITREGIEAYVDALQELSPHYNEVTSVSSTKVGTSILIEDDGGDDGAGSEDGSSSTTTPNADSDEARTPPSEEQSASLLQTTTASSLNVPDNDECEHATHISFDDLPYALINGSTDGATADFDIDDACGATSESRGVWFTFVGSEKHTYISYSNDLREKAQMSLFSGSCENLVCENNFGSSPFQDVVSVVGKRYLLLLTGKTSLAVGDYELSMSQYGDTEVESTVPQTVATQASTSPTTVAAATTATSTTTTKEITTTTATTTTSTSTTTTIPTPTTPLVQTRDSGNDVCENAIEITHLPIARTGTLANTPEFARTVEEGECPYVYRLDSGTQGVWYSIVNEKHRIVRMEYELHLPLKPGYIQVNGRAMIYVFKGSCEVLVCATTTRDSDRGIIGIDKEDFTGSWVVHEFLLEKDETYLLYVAGQGDGVNVNGEYQFNMTQYEVPSNAQCDQATVIDSLPAVFGGSIYGATPSLPVNSDTCRGVPRNSRGVWYHFVGSGRIVDFELSTFNNRGPYSHTVLSVFVGSCSFLLCSDTAYTSSAGSLSLEFFAEEGQLYWLLLSGGDFEDAFDFKLNVTEHTIPSNDKCKDATAIPLLESESPMEIHASTLGATPDGGLLINNDCGAISRGVWYSLEGEGTLVSIAFAGQGVMSLLHGPCNDLACYGYRDGSNDHMKSHLDWYIYRGNKLEFVPGNGDEYKLLISHSETSTYALSLTKYEPPENDSCETATQILSLPFSHHDDMKGARNGTENFPGNRGVWYDYRGVWYAFTGTGAVIQIELNMGNVHEIELLSGSACNDLRQIATRSNELSTPTEAGISYYIFIGTFQGIENDELPFYLTVKELT